MNTERMAIAVEDQWQDTRDHSNMEEQEHAGHKAHHPHGVHVKAAEVRLPGKRRTGWRSDRWRARLAPYHHGASQR
jgi:hypothetical protein